MRVDKYQLQAVKDVPGLWEIAKLVPFKSDPHIADLRVIQLAQFLTVTGWPSGGRRPGGVPQAEKASKMHCDCGGALEDPYRLFAIYHSKYGTEFETKDGGIFKGKPWTLYLMHVTVRHRTPPTLKYNPRSKRFLVRYIIDTKSSAWFDKALGREN
jgi:hypothetical protein